MPIGCADERRRIARVRCASPLAGHSLFGAHLIALGNWLVWQEADVAQSRIPQNQQDGRAENDTFRASTS